MEKIKIYNDFLNESELNTLLNKITFITYGYNHRSGYTEREIVTFFSSMIFDDFFTEHIKEKIEKKLDMEFKIKRNYVHIQTFGIDGCYHFDTLDKDCYTFCLYVNVHPPHEVDQMRGEFFIKVPDLPLILSIEPYMNRGIFFPSNYLHKGMAYNRFYSDKRICITWKLRQIKV